MLICGFEKFENLYVRIDILERLFIQIISSNQDKKSDVMLKPEMLNLLGCNKENFVQLIKKMNYKSYEKEGQIYFKYFSKNNKIVRKNKTIEQKNNPFNVLKEINFK